MRFSNSKLEVWRPLWQKRCIHKTCTGKFLPSRLLITEDDDVCFFYLHNNNSMNNALGPVSAKEKSNAASEN